MIVIVAYIFLPESPRWLVECGRLGEAVDLIHSVAMGSGIELSTFQIDAYLHSTIVKDLKNKQASQRNIGECEEGVATKFGADVLSKTPSGTDTPISPLQEMFSASMWRVSVPLLIVWLCFGMGYSGGILYSTAALSALSSSSGSGTCNFNYQGIFISSTAELLAIILGIPLIDSWGRVRSQTVIFTLAALATLAMAVSTNMYAAVLTFSYISRLCVTLALDATWVMTPELFSTRTRTVATSLCFAAKLVGIFLTSYLVYASGFKLIVIGVVIFGCELVAGFLSCFMPETKNVNLS